MKADCADQKLLPLRFYRGENVVHLARALLGKTLVSHQNGEYCAGIIVETEAYRSWGDKACHAYAGKITKRTATMYEAGGLAYLYLCYGIHVLLNVVCNKAGAADAVLIRALEPTQGIALMQQRRPKVRSVNQLCNGPGKLTKAMGISLAQNGCSLQGPHIKIIDAAPLPEEQIVSKTRIGVEYAGEDALLPWRFYQKNSPCISQK